MDFEKEAKWMVWIVYIPALVGVPFTILIQAMQNRFTFRLFVSIVLQLAGTYLIYRAKKRTIMSGNLVSFGTKTMTKPEATKYIFGCILFILGLILSVQLILKLHVY